MMCNILTHEDYNWSSCRTDTRRRIWKKVLPTEGEMKG